MCNPHLHRTSEPARLNTRQARWRALHRRAENGSVEGGTFGELTYMPFLIGLMLVGLIFALVGFWRVGASYATQYGAQVGAVSPESGGDVMSAVWQGWAHDSLPAGGYAVDDDGRSVSATINQSTSFQFYGFGSWDFSIQAGGELRVRSERFYPGEPNCDEDGCHE